MSWSDLEPGHALRLILGSAGWAREVRELSPLLPGEERDLGSVVVGPEHVVVGLVTGPDGVPVEDARIAIARPVSSFERLKGRVAEEEHSASSDAAGRFSIEGVPEGTFAVEARRAGLVGVRIEPFRVPEDLGGGLVRIRLGRGSAVRGTVVDESGAPLSDARVAHVPSAFDLDLEQATAILARSGVAVNADGSFELGGLPPNRPNVLIASAAGHVLAVRTVEGALEDVRLVLRQAFALEGTVLDGKGNAIPAAEVSLWATDPSTTAGLVIEEGVFAGPDGRFHLVGLPTGEFRLLVLCAAGRAEVGPLWLTSSTAPLVIRVAGSEPVTVRVTDEGLRPVEGVEVRLDLDDEDPTHPLVEELAGPADVRRSTTDARGEARFCDLPSGAWKVRALQGGAVIAERMVSIEEAPALIELVARRPGTIVLDVVDRGGEAVPRASVQLSRREDDAVIPIGGRRRVDDFGRTAWSDLAPGSYVVEYAPVSLDEVFGKEVDTLPGRGTGVNVEVHPERASPVRLALAECVVRVQVTRAGRPVAGAQVGVTSTGTGDDDGHGPPTPATKNFLAGLMLGADLCVTTDGRGWATVVVPEPRDYLIQARSTPQSPLTSQRVEVRSSTEVVTVELAGGAVLGTVTGTYGPLEGVRVRLLPEPPLGKMTMGIQAAPSEAWRFADTTLTAALGESSSYTDGEGRFRFFEVQAGDYRIELDHSGYALQSTDAFLVPDGSTVDLGEARLAPSCVLRGTVEHGRERDPDSGFLGVVRLVAADGSVAGTRDLDESGSYEFTQAAPGRYRLVVQVRETTRESEEFVILPERVNVQDFAVPR